MSTHPSISGESWGSDPQPIRCLPLEEIDPDRYRSVLTMEDLRMIRGYCFIPSQFDLELARSIDRVHCPPSGRLGIYEESSKASLRFLFHPFVIKLMREYNLCPTKIAPNSWHVIIGFLSLCLLHKHNPTMCLFRACYSLKIHPDND